MYEFNYDRSVQFYNYWFVKNMFMDDEIKKIHSLASELVEVEAGVGVDGDVNKTTRTSKIRWLPQTNEYSWIYERIGKNAEKGNDELWKFDLTRMRENIQYTIYNDTHNDHYTWHSDINGEGILTQRKISCVVFLDEQGVDYEGGDLLANTKGEPWVIPVQKKGTGIFFPSFWLHKVTPVTKGTRRTLVIWMGGEPFR